MKLDHSERVAGMVLRVRDVRDDDATPATMVDMILESEDGNEVWGATTRRYSSDEYTLLAARLAAMGYLKRVIRALARAGGVAP